MGSTEGSAQASQYQSDCTLWDDVSATFPTLRVSLTHSLCARWQGLVDAVHTFLGAKGITEDFVQGLHDYVFNKV